MAFNLTFSASACDSKSCEAAYLAESQRHVENQIRRAESYRLERHAYSKNRERRAYAHYVHINIKRFFGLEQQTKKQASST